jgi:hypothetical protein
MERVTDNINNRPTFPPQQCLSHSGNRITILSFITPINVVANDLQTRLATAEQSAILIITNEYRLGKSSNMTVSSRALDTA